MTIFARQGQCILNMSINTMFNNFILCIGAIWWKLKHCQPTLLHNSFYGLYCIYSHSFSSLIIDHSSPKQKYRWFRVRHLFNKHARFVSRYTGLRFQGDVDIHRYFGQESLVTVVATLWQYCTFSSCTDWNFCSGKPSPEALSKQHCTPDSDHSIGACQY